MRPLHVPRAHVRRSATPSALRRGMATVWLLIWSPVFLLMLLLVVEIGHLWVSQVQLETALEAAALAAVKRWRDTDSTSDARDYAVDYAAANTAGGAPVILDRNDGGGGPNDNLSCDGDIVLGVVYRPDDVPDTDCNHFIFDANEGPLGGGSGILVSLTIMIQTHTDTKNDVQNHRYPFMIYDFSSNQAGLEIASVEFNVATTPPQDQVPAFFDLRNPPGVGVSNDQHFGIEPIFQGTDVDGFTASPDFSFDSTSPTYRINFPDGAPDPFEAGTPLGSPSTDRFDFGVDTDRVGPDPGAGDNRFADKGGDFFGTTVTVTFRLGGSVVGTITGQMIQIDEHTSILEFVEEEIRSGNRGVRVRHEMTIEPFCKSLLGVPVGPYKVCGEATAMIEGPNGQPQLIRIFQFLCN